MQVIPVAVFLIVFAITDCSEINKTSISTTHIEANHRKLPLFPRSNIKFVVNIRKIPKQIRVDQDITTKKPLMPKIVPKTKIEVNMYDRVAVTRKPLMKLRNFTVETIINRRIHKSDENQNPTKGAFQENANNFISKHDSNDLGHKSKKVENVAKGRARVNRLPKAVASTTVNYFAEEHKDRKEFIFLNSTNDGKVAVHDLLQMDERDLETTTVKVDVKENSRPKRRINVIEEENRVTTIPLRKYTDHDVKLNNDRFFKNVNT